MKLALLITIVSALVVGHYSLKATKLTYRPFMVDLVRNGDASVSLELLRERLVDALRLKNESWVNQEQISQGLVWDRRLEELALSEAERLAKADKLVPIDLSLFKEWNVKVEAGMIYSRKQSSVKMPNVLVCSDNFWGSKYQDVYGLEDTCLMKNEQFDQYFNEYLFTRIGYSVARSENGDLFLVVVYAREKSEEELDAGKSYWLPESKQDESSTSSSSNVSPGRLQIEWSYICRENQIKANDLGMRPVKCYNEQLSKLALAEAKRIAKTGKITEPDMSVFNGLDVHVVTSIFTEFKNKAFSGFFKCYDNFWQSEFKDLYELSSGSCEMRNKDGFLFNMFHFTDSIREVAAIEETGEVAVVEIWSRRKSQQEINEGESYWFVESKKDSEIRPLSQFLLYNSLWQSCVGTNELRVNDYVPPVKCYDETLSQIVLREVERIAKEGKLVQPDLSLFKQWNVKLELGVYTGFNLTSDLLVGQFICAENFWQSEFKPFYLSNETCGMANKYGFEFTEDIFSIRLSETARGLNGEIFSLTVYALPKSEQELAEKQSYWVPVPISSSKQDDELRLSPGVLLSQSYRACYDNILKRRRFSLPIKLECNENREVLEWTWNEVQRLAKLGKLEKPDLSFFKNKNVQVILQQIHSFDPRDKTTEGDLLCFDNFWGSEYKQVEQRFCEMRNRLGIPFSEDLFNYHTFQSVRAENGDLFAVIVKSMDKNAQEQLEGDKYWIAEYEQGAEVQKISSGILYSEFVFDAAGINFNRSLIAQPPYNLLDFKLIDLAHMEVRRIADIGRLVQPNIEMFKEWNVQLLVQQITGIKEKSGVLIGTNWCTDNFWSKKSKENYPLTEDCDLTNKLGQRFDTGLFEKLAIGIARAENGDIYQLNVLARERNEQEEIEGDLYWTPEFKENVEIQQVSSGIMYASFMTQCTLNNIHRLEANLPPVQCLDPATSDLAELEARRIAKIGKLSQPDLSLFKGRDVKVMVTMYTGFNVKSNEFVFNFLCADNFWQSQYKDLYESNEKECEMRNRAGEVFDEDLFRVKVTESARSVDGSVFVVTVFLR